MSGGHDEASRGADGLRAGPRADLELLPSQAAVWAGLGRAVDAGLHTMLVGDVGSGRTSLLFRLEADRDEVAYVPCRDVDGLSALTARIVEHVTGRPWSLTPRSELAHVEAMVDALDAHGPAVVALDDLDVRPELARRLLGAYRDQVSEAGVTWVTSATPALAASLDASPAGDLFGARVALAPLGRDEVERLVEGWVEGAMNGAGDRVRGAATTLAREADLPTPAVALRAVGQLVAAAAPDEVAATLVARQRTAEELPDAARRVLSLLGSRAASASDPWLADAAALSRPRLTQLLGELAERGLVDATRNGRRVVYAPTVPA